MIVIDLDGLAHYGYGGPLVRWEVKTAPCGCKYVAHGLRDVQVLEHCERRRVGRKP